MNIHSHDQDLLLLSHGALPLGRAALIRAHVLVCPNCRARLHRFESVSRVMAGAVRGRDLPAWPGPAGTAVLSTLAGWLLVLTVTLTLTALLVWGVMKWNHRPVAVGPQTTSGGGCRPDLPSDQCR